MSNTELIEWLLIAGAVLSLIPFAFGYHQAWYKAALILPLAAMILVARNRLRRHKEAFDDARRAQDEIQRRRGKPML